MTTVPGSAISAAGSAVPQWRHVDCVPTFVYPHDAQSRSPGGGVALTTWAP